MVGIYCFCAHRLLTGRHPPGPENRFRVAYKKTLLGAQDETEKWLEQVLEATDLWLKPHQGAERKLQAQ